MTEERRGEIALLILEMIPSIEGIDSNIDETRKFLQQTSKDLCVSVESLESIFRPACDKFINQLFPSMVREVFPRRDLEAKQIAIKIFEFGIKAKSPFEVCSFWELHAIAGEISGEELLEFAESFFPQ